ncbi:hypothetical protein EMIT0P44_260059 [Pseudomonas sp. IT-P44]
MPTAQNLHSASRGGDYRHSRRGGLKADLAHFVYALSFSDALTHSGYVHRSPVGARLLAMAVGQSTHLLIGRTLSPASRLLHGDWVHTTKNCRSRLAGDGRQR